MNGIESMYAFISAGTITLIGIAVLFVVFRYQKKLDREFEEACRDDKSR